MIHNGRINKVVIIIFVKFFEGLYKNLTVNVAGNSTRSSVLTELLSDTTYSINVRSHHTI